MNYKNKFTSALFALLLLALLAGTAHAQTLEQKTQDMNDRIWNEEAPLVAVLTTIALLIIALAYMGSQVMQRREWEGWARNAAFQLGVAFAVLIGINIILLSSSALSHAMTGKDLYVASDDYLGGLVYATGFPLVYTLTEESISNQLEAVNFQFESNPWSGGYGSAKSAGEKTKANAQDMLTNILMPMIASLYAQRVILQASADFAVPLIIPIAFALRLLPQTRSPADQLLALAVGFGAILPLTYVLNMAIANTIDMPSLMAPMAAADPDLHLAEVSSLIPQAVFLPNLSIVITVSFIMAFSKFLVRGFEPEAPNEQ